MESSTFDLTSLTADIVSAYVANNALSGDKTPATYRFRLMAL